MLTERRDVAVWQGGAFAQDSWRLLADDDALPEHGDVVVGLARWRELGQRNTFGDVRVGVLVRAGERVEEIESGLGRIPLVCLDFPAFSDGRSFSAARLLRERYGYAGEIRATGDVLLDQIPFMLRCGFDSLAISHEPTRRALQQGRLPEVPLFLQPAGERGEVPVGTRPWLRRRAQHQIT